MNALVLRSGTYPFVSESLAPPLIKKLSFEINAVWKTLAGNFGDDFPSGIKYSFQLHSFFQRNIPI